MYKAIKVISFALFVTLDTSLAAHPDISPHTIIYKLFGYGLDLGVETRQLTLSHQTYTYASKAQTQGLAKLFTDYKINAQSVFTLDTKIKSNAFDSIEYHNDTIKKQINLVWQDEILTNTVNNKTWKNNNTLDFLNIFIALSYDFQMNNPLTYTIANGKKIKTYEFQNKGLRNLSIAGESIAAVKLVADTLEVFIAEKYDYLPVFIQKNTWKYELKQYKKTN